MKRLNFLIFSILLTSFSYAAFPKNAPVATVNGKKIMLHDFLRNYEQTRLFISDKLITKEKVLNDLINREIGIQRAQKNKLASDPVVKNKMEDIMYHAQVSKDLEPRLKDIKVTDSDVKKYYKKKPEYRTAHILFRMLAKPNDKEIKGALDQALKVYQELKNSPDKFSELANRFSQSSTAPAGGDMGFQPAKALAPEYFQAINGKEPGYIAPPIRTGFGFHIIKLLSTKKYENINMGYYKKIVYDIKRDAIMDRYFTELRKKAKISINKKLMK